MASYNHNNNNNNNKLTNGLTPPTVTTIENSVFYLKTNTDFNFPSYSLKELLYRTTASNLEERLWKKIFKFEVDTSCLKGIKIIIKLKL
jgi:hypothetical protein